MLFAGALVLTYLDEPVTALTIGAGGGGAKVLFKLFILLVLLFMFVGDAGLQNAANSVSSEPALLLVSSLFWFCAC